GGDDQNVLLAGGDDLNVGGHLGLEESFVVAGDLDLDLEGDDVGDVDALGGDADDLAAETRAWEGVDGNRDRLVHLDLADVAFVDAGEDEDLREVGKGHDGGAAGHVGDARRDDLAFLHVEGGDDAVHR